MGSALEATGHNPDEATQPLNFAAIDRLIRSRLRRFRSSGDYEDLYQECWAHVLRRYADWQSDRCEATTWCCEVIRGAVAAHVSRETSERRRNRVYGSTCPVASWAVDWWAIYAVRLAVEDLPDDQQEIVRLMFWHDLTLPEIARRVGAKYSNTHRKLQQATSRLRDSLGDSHAVVGPLRATLALSARPAPKRNRRQQSL